MFNDKENKVPMEFPSIQRPEEIDQIVDVIEKEVFPMGSTNQQKSISEALQE